MFLARSNINRPAIFVLRKKSPLFAFSSYSKSIKFDENIDINNLENTDFEQDINNNNSDFDKNNDQNFDNKIADNPFEKPLDDDIVFNSDALSVFSRSFTGLITTTNIEEVTLLNKPAYICKSFLEFLHLEIGCEWWIAIVLFAVCLRFLHAPLRIKAKRYSSNYKYHSNFIRSGNKALQKLIAQNEQRKKFVEKFKEFKNKNRIKILRSILFNLSMIPFFVVGIRALKSMSVVDPTFVTGGISFFTDLTVQDPLRFFPMFYTALMYQTIFKVMSALKIDKNSSKAKIILATYKGAVATISSSFMLLFFSSNFFNSTILLFFISSKITLSLTDAILERNRFQNLFGIFTEEQIASNNIKTSKITPQKLIREWIYKKEEDVIRNAVQLSILKRKRKLNRD